MRLIAADLAAGGVDVDLDVRRAQALGVMARRMLGAAELPAVPTAESGTAEPGGLWMNGTRTRKIHRPATRATNPMVRFYTRYPASQPGLLLR